MPDFSLLILVLVALLIGWAVGRARRSTTVEVDDLPTAAIKSLTEIINQESDISIDRFIDEFDVTESTFETHMALGNVSRRRGEIEKAIKIHQNLISRPNLSPKLQDEAYFELAKDYLQAGLLDRAETLFCDLVKADGVFRRQAQYLLLGLYEDEQEWHLALETARELAPKRLLRQRSPEENSVLKRMAHYHCEIAESALDKHDYVTALEAINKGQSVSKKSLRAAYLRANLAAKQNDAATIEKLLPLLIFKQSKLLFEALWLVKLYLRTKPEHAAIRYLTDLYEQVESAEVLALLPNYGASAKQTYEHLLSGHIQKIPSNRALGLWVSSSQALAQMKPEQRRLFSDVFTRASGNEKRYRCTDCGFSGKQFYWRCPTCKGWDTVELIRGERVD